MPKVNLRRKAQIVDVFGNQVRGMRTYTNRNELIGEMQELSENLSQEVRAISETGQMFLTVSPESETYGHA